jgi:putative DNA primase/helicase
MMVSGYTGSSKRTPFAIRRRMNLLPFTVTISDEERDPLLVKKLRKEWPGILTWMIEGCLQWQRSGLKPPQKIIVATNDYLDDEDTLGNFLDEHCILDVNAEMSSADLFNEWKHWAGENNAFIGSAKMFAGWMGERGFAKTRDRAGNNNVFKGLQFANPFLGGGGVAPQQRQPPPHIPAGSRRGVAGNWWGRAWK